MFFVSAIRRLFFAEIKPLVKLAKVKVLQAEDMPRLPAPLNPRVLAIDETKLDLSSGRAFLKSLLREGRPFLVPTFTLNLAYIALNLTKPVLVNGFIARIGSLHSPGDFHLALAWALSLGSVSLAASCCVQHYFYKVLGAYQKYTNLINRMIYRHSLMLTQKARGESQMGDIVNYMSSDNDSVADLTQICGDLMTSTLSIVGAAALLFYYLGFTALVSVGLLLLLVPLTRRVARSFAVLDEELMHQRDRRVTMMSQVLSGIRVVKFFAWERSVRKEVNEVRTLELGARRRLARAEALATLSYVAVSTVVLFASLGMHVMRGFTLTPELVFTIVMVFALLEEPFGHLSEAVSRVAQAFVSSDRICAFLRRERLPATSHKELFDEGQPGIELEGVTVRFAQQATPALSDVELRILPGESVAVVGPVGSGKSAFLQALIREVPLERGRVAFVDKTRKSLNPRIAYVPQEAFIMNGTLRENIFFGATENPDRLAAALRVSCLESDLPQLPAGLFTEIGERGVNLSGGQKQRVSLARAVIHEPTLVLLDDPLSAVDVRTEEQLVERLLFGEWRQTTRVVATHRLAHLARFDKVVFLVDGRVRAVGTLDEIATNCLEFRAFFADSARAEQSAQFMTETPSASTATAAPAGEANTEARVTEDEDRAVGAVKKRVYLDYLAALGGSTVRGRWLTLPLLALSAVAASSFPLLQKSWLALTSNAQTKSIDTSQGWLAGLAADSGTAVAIYGAFGLLTLCAVLVNRLFWLERGMAAGRDLHEEMLRSVLGAPLRFFDSTPIGRILQRFSRDVESVDTHLQWSFELTVRCLVNIATALFLILGALPVMLVVIGPVLFCYYLLQRDYRIPAREAKRLDAINRSPRFAHFKETLQGLVVIRSFGKTGFFLEGFLDRLAHSQRMFYGHYMLNRWFSSRIPVLGGFVSSGTAVGIAFYAYNGWISPGLAGLVVVYALSLWESLNWAVRVFADVEARMTSVERLKYYGSLESEREVNRTPVANIDAHWPLKGEVVFDRLVARYASHLPPTLKGISFRVPAGARVGIIGRTGSGKSTLLQALYRCMEAEEGEIRIDGVDIATVPLERLRRSLAIIPQDPTLFMGTLRNNLDRYGEYSDEEVWLALRKARLEGFVRALPLGLQAPVLESGSNLSQGQRQLLCLARALLADAKVIVMDEATASVDVQTDGLVQEVVRESCKNVTMLIIAHRLGTVSDCDLIVEVREGRVHRTLDLKKENAKVPVC